MRIVLTSVFVDDQEKALRFYRDVLGFKPKVDIPMGSFAWIADPDGNTVGLWKAATPMG